MSSPAASTGPIDCAVDPERAAERSRRVRTSSFLRFATGYWRGDGARPAWLLTAAVIAIVLVNLLVSIGMNQWNRWFFDALEKRQEGILLQAAALFVLLIVVGAAFAVLMVRARMTLQLRWRAWLTNRLVGWWLDEQRYYRLAITDEEETSSPEYRIADDVRIATEPVVELAIGFLNAFLNAVAFVSILLVVGGSITITVFGTAIWIPGYLGLAAVLYAAILSYATWRLGQPLVGRVAAKNQAEGQFRYELTRLRQNAESIALIKGDADERERITETFSETAARWLDVIRQHCQLTWIFNSNAFFSPVLPVLLATPKFLTGELTLGAVMQIATAFVAVLAALNWFVENYIRLAEWSASACRVDELRSALAEIDTSMGDTSSARISVAQSPDQNMHLKGLSVAHRSGRVLISEAEVTIEPGEKVLLKGESGAGKSTLIRAIAGLWPWGTGQVLLPQGANLAFVPQKPYLPLGNLREAVTYPVASTDVPNEAIIEALNKTGLGHLATHLDRDEDWDRILSGGERQRVAFARLIIQRPDVIVMDEATSALDGESQARLLGLMAEEFGGAIVISVGHRPELEDFHNRTLVLERQGETATLSAGRVTNRLWRFIAWVAAKTAR